MPPPPRTVLEELFIRSVVLAYAVPTRLLDLAMLAWRPRLLVAYLRLWAAALRRSPYRWPTSFESILALKRASMTPTEAVYGETPLCTAVRLFRRAGVKSGAHVVDLTAGRGRPLLAARWLGAQATGVEVLEQHVRIAAPILRSVGAELRCGDGTAADLAGVTHVYVCWPDLSARTRSRLVTTLRTLDEGARVIALQHPIDDDDFVELSRSTVMTVWGPETAIVYERTG